MHCLATAVLLALLSAAGGLLGAPWIHEVGLTLAMMLGAFALGRGILEHGFMMPSAVGGLGLGVMAGALTLPHDGSEALVHDRRSGDPRARPPAQPHRRRIGLAARLPRACAGPIVNHGHGPHTITSFMKASRCATRRASG